ncbi:MAG: efflux RND transporter permease subunit [Longimicrobiales bacterium]
MSLPRLSIARPVGVAMFYIAVVCLGLLSFTRLPIDLLPDIAYPKLVIYTTYPDVAPSEVERFVTEPIEQAVARVPGVERVESNTREGISMVVLRFAWGVDMDFAALNVRERVDQIRDALPEQAERPVVLRTDPRSEPIAAISVSGPTNLWSLKELAESVYRRRLEQLEGVAQALVTGGLEREIHVDIDLARLESYGITIQQVSTALDRANQSAPSGSILQGRFRYPLRALGELQQVKEIENVVVARPQPGGASGSGAAGLILVSDLGAVDDGFKEREAIARYNGKEAVGILIFKESGANTVRVMQEVDEVLGQLRAEYPTVTVDIASSQAGFVSGAIANLVQEMLLGGLLAFLVLVLFLRDPRFPVAVGLAIPISVIVTFALLHAFNVSLNIMSLGGLALGVGMLVDNSIVVIENIFRHREKGLVAAVSATIGTEEVQRAITASTLTTIAVFGPIIYVQGVAGQLFAALSFSVAFSLMVSLIVACSLLPAMAARWEKDRKEGSGEEGKTRAGALRTTLARPLHAFDRAFARFAAWYEGILALALRHRATTIWLSVLAFLLTIPAALTLDRSVLPEVDQGSFRARLELARGTPIEATLQTAERLEQILRADPGVEAIFTHVGRRSALLSSEQDDSGLNTALLEVRLKGGKGTPAALERLRPQLKDFPPGTLALETGQATALGKLLGGSEADLAVRVRGDDLNGALSYAREVQTRLLTVNEVANVHLGMELGQPEILVQVNRERAAAFGIEAREVADLVEQYMGGVRATDFIAFDRKIPVILRLPESSRRSLTTLNRLSVRGIPLRELVTVTEAISPSEIRRVDQSRTVPVYADVVTGDVEEAVAAIRASIAPLAVPRDLRVEIGGENEEMRKSFRDLALALTLALLLVYMILAAEFESLIHPFTILLSVPLALIGAVWALLVFGAGINTVSLIGVIVLVGIVDNDAVVKIDFINQMRREGMSVRNAILAAGHARLRPIVMNTLTVMFSVAPLMFGLGPGADLQAPLAITVFGGLFTATALTLIVIPVAYELIDELGQRLKTRFRGEVVQPARVRETEAPQPVTAGGD